MNRGMRHTDWVWIFFSCLIGLTLLGASSGGIQWGDSGAYLLRAASGELFPPELLAMSHPFYTFVNGVLHRLGGNAAVACLNMGLLPVMAWQVHGLIRGLGGTRSAAWLGLAACLGLHVVMWASTKVEVYMLHLVLTLACFQLLVLRQERELSAWPLIMLGTLVGLGISTHQLTFIVMSPVVLWLAWTRIKGMPWFVVGVALGLFACYPALLDELSRGKSVFEIARAFLTNGNDAGQLHWEGQLLNVRGSLQQLDSVVCLLYSLLGVGLWGALSFHGKLQARLLWLCAWCNLVFALTYNVGDRFSFCLPGMVLFVILGALRVGKPVSPDRPARLMFAMQLLLVLGPLALSHLAVWYAHQVPGAGNMAVRILRDKAHLIAPLLKDDSAEQFVRDMEQVVPPGGVVYAEFVEQQALLNGQEMGRFHQRQVIDCMQLPLAQLTAPAFVVGRCPHVPAEWLTPVKGSEQVKQLMRQPS
jgi:hypothetical protein